MRHMRHRHPPAPCFWEGSRLHLSSFTRLATFIVGILRIFSKTSANRYVCCVCRTTKKSRREENLGPMLRCHAGETQSGRILCEGRRMKSAWQEVFHSCLRHQTTGPMSQIGNPSALGCVFSLTLYQRRNRWILVNSA